jgi:hypothetical protein
MRTIRTSAPALIAACLATLLAGCVGGGERYETEAHADRVEAPLAPATHFQLADIPVPAQLSYDRANSIITETPGDRGASLVYHGRVHAERVATFFRDQMPAIGWKMTSYQRPGERHLLNFVKGPRPERCRISIEPNGVGSVRAVIDLN